MFKDRIFLGYLLGVFAGIVIGRWRSDFPWEAVPEAALSVAIAFAVAETADRIVKRCVKGGK